MGVCGLLDRLGMAPEYRFGQRVTGSTNSN